MRVCLSSKKGGDFNPSEKKSVKFGKLWGKENVYMKTATWSCPFNISITSVPKRKHTFQIKKLSMLLRETIVGGPIPYQLRAGMYTTHTNPCNSSFKAVIGYPLVQHVSYQQSLSHTSRCTSQDPGAKQTDTLHHIDHMQLLTYLGRHWNFFWTLKLVLDLRCQSCQSYIISQKLENSPGIQGFLSKNLRHSAFQGHNVFPRKQREVSPHPFPIFP